MPTQLRLTLAAARAAAYGRDLRGCWRILSRLSDAGGSARPWRWCMASSLLLLWIWSREPLLHMFVAHERGWILSVCGRVFDGRRGLSYWASGYGQCVCSCVRRNIPLTSGLFHHKSLRIETNDLILKSVSKIRIKGFVNDIRKQFLELCAVRAVEFSISARTPQPRLPSTFSSSFSLSNIIIFHVPFLSLRVAFHKSLQPWIRMSFIVPQWRLKRSLCALRSAELLRQRKSHNSFWSSEGYQSVSCCQ